jgi:hypothetical protein
MFAYALTVTSFVIAISFFIASRRDPGYLRPELGFMELLSKIDPCEMCPDCEILRTPRSKHCAICNRCVERFDHHCPWLNNCVGVYNHNPYLIFIMSLLTVLILIVASSVLMLVDECHPRQHPTDEICPLVELCIGCKILWLRYSMLLVTTLIALFFGGPACALCYVHFKNYSAAKTTNERFTKANVRADSEFSESVGSVADLRSMFDNDNNPG